MGLVWRLQQRGQLLLVRLVFQKLQLDPGARVGSLETPGHIGIKRRDFGVLFQVQPAYGTGLYRLCGQTRADQRQRGQCPAKQLGFALH